MTSLLLCFRLSRFQRRSDYVVPQESCPDTRFMAVSRLLDVELVAADDKIRGANEAAAAAAAGATTET